MKEPRFVREFRSYVVLQVANSNLDKSAKKELYEKAYSSLDFLGRGLVNVDETMRILMDVLDCATEREITEV